MADEAVELFRMLVEAGAKPGEDFSYDLGSGSAQISDRAFEKLRLAFPNVDWESISKRVELDPNLPADYLNTYLGVDFVPRMLSRIEQRLSELPPGQAAWYLQQVLGGVEQRTKVPMYVLLQQRLPLAKQALLETRLRQQTEPCYLWIRDLVEAAGGAAEDVETTSSDATLTENGLNLLTTVWTGEYDLQEDTAPEAVGETIAEASDAKDNDAKAGDTEDNDIEVDDLNKSDD